MKQFDSDWGGLGPSYWSRFLLLAVGYTTLGIFVLSAELSHPAIGRIVWPASGLGLAALALWGTRLWPAVALGSAVATYYTGGAWSQSLATAVGNALEVWLAATLLRKARFDPHFGSARHVIAFTVLASLGALVSALFGVLGLAWSASAPVDILPRIAWLWAAGHAMGAVVTGPFFLTLSQWKRWVRQPPRVAEAAALFIALGVVQTAAFRTDSAASLSYLPFPLLMWAAYRFGPAGAAPANLILGSLALWWTALGQGPFSTADNTSSAYLFTWGYATVTAITALFFAATIAEGRSAEDRRRRQANDYRLLIEQAADGVLIFSPEGKCVDANTSACDMLGLSRAQLIGRMPQALVADSQIGLADAQINSLQAGATGQFAWRIRLPDGSTFPADVSAKRFSDGRIQAFLRDVTARKSLEEQLNQAQKIEAAGQLAGGVAHEFNNLLTLMLGHALAIRSELEAESPADDHLTKVVSAAERAGKLTRRLLTFARKQPAEPQTIPLNDLVSEMAGVLPRMMGEDVQFVTVPSNDPWLVRVDPGLLQQVVLNLALNARDAMPDGGRLVMECRNVHLSETWTRERASISVGDYAVLAVTDTGKGMTPETAARIFEPFFTTKSPNKGAGLGMAVSHGIILQAGGDIRIISEPGKGTTVEIYLPRTRGSSAEVPAVPRPREPSRARGGETILVIEDEQGLKELAVDILTARGYVVLTAADGEEGIRICSQKDVAIHLVVSDVVLPGVNGPEAVRTIRQKRPKVRVLFVSGYSEERMAISELETVGTGFLAKPFRPDELSAAVRAMLDDRDAPAAPAAD